MSLTLGEKLRQARDERGLTLSEVAEQTRISSLYLESIENDDYRILPGGIFNKGFVKSYAKLVGVDEAEALSDYSALISKTSNGDEDELKVYRPEVLTDDRSAASMAPTIILAVVILGVMTAGILFLVDYMRRPVDAPIANTETNVNTESNSEITTETPSPSNAPEMATLKVVFKALDQPVSLTAINDGTKTSSLVTPGTAANFEPKESLVLSYSKSLATAVELTINGKAITLPAEPLVPKRNAIEFEINKENLSKIWLDGAISKEGPQAVPVDENRPEVDSESTPLSAPTPEPTAQTPTRTPAATPARPSPTPKPTVSTNANVKPAPEKKASPPTMLPKPNPTTPAANNPD